MAQYGFSMVRGFRVRPVAKKETFTGKGILSCTVVELIFNISVIN